MSSARTTIHLWDIDGTLVSTGGAGRRAMERAFEQVLGARTFGDFGFGGMTDRAIVREAFVRSGRVPDEEALTALLDVYLGYLAQEVPRTTGYRVMPGVWDALDRAATRTDIATGLGTGNLEQGASLKLRPARLDERFAFGGFGSDHEDRAALLARGAERGASRLGVPLEDCRVVVIGDTPRDVEAAHRIGAECIAVATGTFSLPELEAARPAFACADLTHADVQRLLFGP